MNHAIVSVRAPDDAVNVGDVPSLLLPDAVGFANTKWTAKWANFMKCGRIGLNPFRLDRTLSLQ